MDNANLAEDILRREYFRMGLSCTHLRSSRIIKSIRYMRIKCEDIENNKENKNKWTNNIN